MQEPKLKYLETNQNLKLLNYKKIVITKTLVMESTYNNLNMNQNRILITIN